MKVSQLKTARVTASAASNDWSPQYDPAPSLAGSNWLYMHSVGTSPWMHRVATIMPVLFEKVGVVWYVNAGLIESPGMLHSPAPLVPWMASSPSVEVTKTLPWNADGRPTGSSFVLQVSFPSERRLPTRYRLETGSSP